MYLGQVNGMGVTNEQIATGAALSVLFVPSLMGAALGALIANKGDRARYAVAGAVAVPLLWLLSPKGK